MNAIDLFRLVGKLYQVRWKHRHSYHIARIEKLDGDLVHFSVRLWICGTWLPGTPIPRHEFLSSFVPKR